MHPSAYVLWILQDAWLVIVTPPVIKVESTTIVLSSRRMIIVIFLNDENITDLPMYQRAKRGIGYLAQEASVFRTLSVEEFVLIQFRFGHGADEFPHGDRTVAE